MKASTREWIAKAEADFVSAGREYRARKHPNYDAACFFAQQCTEKYLKAHLTEVGIAFPRTHDLEVLLDLSLSAKPLWEAYRPTVVDLTAFAVAFRYPGDSATRNMACKAVKDAGRVRDQIRRDMGMHSS
jgi:HEPN domain-containing protein